MLTFYGVDTSGERCSLPAPVYLQIACDRDTPADSLRLVFSEEFDREFAQIHIKDGEEDVMSAVVDEQIFTCKQSLTTEIIGRSMAALLLDNEAKPQNFVNITLGVLYSMYMKPCGVESFMDEDRCLQGAFNVSKGMSCWQVAESFGRKLFGKAPCVVGRVVDFSGKNQNGKLVFSDEGTGIPYTSFTHNRLRCRLISRIRAKTDVQGDYTTVIENKEAADSDVTRERFLNASVLSAQSLSDGYDAIKKSSALSREIKLECPVRLTGVIGADAVVKCRGKVYEDFYVKSLKYILDKKGESTLVTLHRKEN